MYSKLDLFQYNTNVYIKLILDRYDTKIKAEAYYNTTKLSDYCSESWQDWYLKWVDFVQFEECNKKRFIFADFKE